MSWFRKKMWLAVENGWSGWIDTPNSGADASTSGWGTDATFLNGGGYANHTWDTHKRYTFEWSDASSRQAAQFMQSLRNSAYGKGLIHFIEPTIYDTNILPARVAQPSLQVEDGGRPLVYGVNPVIAPTSNWQARSLPVESARWVLDDVLPGYRSDEESVYIPIPEGYMLAVGAVYNATGSAGLFLRYGDEDVSVPASAPASNMLIQFSDPLYSSDHRVARLWIGKTGAGASAIRISAIVARLIPRNKVFRRALPGFGYGEQPYGAGPYGGSKLSAAWTALSTAPWIGGMGNSGVRFNGTPTMIHNTGVNGGQVGYSASFVETGAWN